MQTHNEESEAAAAGDPPSIGEQLGAWLVEHPDFVPSLPPSPEPVKMPGTEGNVGGVSDSSPAPPAPPPA